MASKSSSQIIIEELVKNGISLEEATSIARVLVQGQSENAHSPQPKLEALKKKPLLQLIKRLKNELTRRDIPELKRRDLEYRLKELRTEYHHRISGLRRPPKVIPTPIGGSVEEKKNKDIDGS